MQFLQMIPIYYDAKWTDLFAQHLNHPLLDVYADNLVQIYPRHAFRGIIPKIWGEIKKKHTLNDSHYRALLPRHRNITYSCKLNTSQQLLH